MNPVGVVVVASLDHATLGVYAIRPFALSLAVKTSSNESRCSLRLAIPAADLSEIFDRSDSDGEINLILQKTYDGAANVTAHTYTFNNKGYDYSAGGKSSTVEINGTKYITAATPVTRTLNRYISKDVQKLGVDYRTTYRVPILDVIDWSPGDTVAGGTLWTINYDISAVTAAATIEVI